jgi:hypothetical protein
MSRAIPSSADPQREAHSQSPLSLTMSVKANVADAGSESKARPDQEAQMLTPRTTKLTATETGLATRLMHMLLHMHVRDLHP